MKYAPLAVVFLLMTANISCSTGNDVETPQASVPDINKSLTVAAPPEANVFKIGEPLSILIQNQTERQIFVRPEDAVLIEQKSRDGWLSVQNNIDSVSKAFVLSPHSAEDRGLMAFFVVPIISAQNQVVLRITVTGRLESTNQEVIGYVEVTLSP